MNATAPAGSPDAVREHEGALRALSLTTFFIFFNAYMIAPLIPSLSKELGAPTSEVGWIVPAYMIPYGISTLFYGPLSDRIGRRKVLLALLLLSVFTTYALSVARTVESLIAWRFVAGLCAGGIVPIGLALVGDLFPFQTLGRAMGWMFGAIAGGMSFGSTLGAWLNPVMGWRNEFRLLALANLVSLVFVYLYRASLERSARHRISLRQIGANYFALMTGTRSLRTYTFIFLNGMFHSGLFSWLGVYFARRYQLGDVGIGLTLLGYGLPGLFLGPVFGRIADRYGRKKLIPWGFLLAAVCAFGLIPAGPLISAALIATVLSVGFDMSHPLMTGIIVSLNSSRRGQAMGFNAFAVFTGFGLGALVFQRVLESGFNFALAAFGISEAILGLIAFYAFRNERPA